MEDARQGRLWNSGHMVITEETHGKGMEMREGEGEKKREEDEKEEKNMGWCYGERVKGDKEEVSGKAKERTKGEEGEGVWYR